MALTTAPLLSMSARGTIGKTVTYSAWKGVQYARQRVIPANPNSVAQQAQRNLFRWVHDAYKYLPADVQAPWVEYSKGQPFTPANAWMTANNVALKGETTVADIVFSKPVRSGPPTPSITATPGSGQITVAAGTPGTIAGWSITKMIAICMKNVDPTGEMEEIISASAEGTTAPYSAVVTGLLHTQAYVCGAFFEYLRADGMVAYGASINTTATTT